MNIPLVLIAVVLFSSCHEEINTIVHPPAPTGDSLTTAPLRFITKDYIELNTIERISKFRSGIGHDYRDDAESCRSMKHYYQPKASVSWSAVKIFSPVTGTVVRTFDEWAGTQIWIRPTSSPLHTIIIFHIALKDPLSVGDTLAEGMHLGTHIGPQTMSDIAVGYSANNRWQLVSYFSVMSDSLFASYAARGITSREELIISPDDRNADPLHCSGESFGTSGKLENWVLLK